MSVLEDSIRRFKKIINKLHMNVVKRDEDLQIIISCWGPDVVSWEQPAGDPPEDLKELWEWLWQGVTVDEDVLMNKAGIIHGKGKLNMAILLRMIYPDGTRNETVEEFLGDSKRFR